MRLIKLDRVREGMILGRTVYGPNNEVFLRRGTNLKAVYIASLRRMKYTSIYINDRLSDGIEIREAVTEGQRNNAIRAIKQAFSQSLSGSDTRMKFSGLPEAIEGMIDQILYNRGTIDNLTALKTYDEYTLQHSVNTCIIAVLMGTKLKYTRDELRDLGLAAILHDIGKVAIPYEIINKPAKLTNDEYELVKRHPMLGFDIISESQDFPPEVAWAIRQHHERPDGLGYLENITDTDIHPYAKLIALADVYDAITSERSYKTAMHTFEAYEYIMSNIGTQFDGAFSQMFLKSIAPFPVGTCVKLSNGLVGIVIKNHPDLMMRPRLRLADTREELDLTNINESLSLTITEVIRE